MRTFIGAPIVGFLDARFMSKRLRGFSHCAALNVLSVCVTGPISAACTTMLFVGPGGFSNAFASTIAFTLPATVIVNQFAVGPAVKMLFNNRISPVGGLNALMYMEHCATPLLWLIVM